MTGQPGENQGYGACGASATTTANGPAYTATCTLPFGHDGQHRGLNYRGVPCSIHVCSACGDAFSVTPPAGPNFGDGCLGPDCGSYDIERDVEYLLAAGQRLVRKDEPNVP